MAERAGHTARDRVVPAAIGAKDAAVERVTPAVESARDRVVDDLLPRLADAAVAAASAAKDARDSAMEGAKGAAVEAAGKLPTAKAARRRRRRRRFTFLAATTAAVAAAVAVLRSRRSQDTEEWTSADAEGGTVVGVFPPTTPTEGESLGAVVVEDPVSDVTTADEPAIDPLTSEPVSESTDRPADEDDFAGGNGANEPAHSRQGRD